MTKPNFRSVTWKRNLNQIPTPVKAKLEAQPDANFVAGFVKSIPTAVLQGRMFGHMGIGIINGALSHLARILPPAAMGKYSTRNREDGLSSGAICRRSPRRSTLILQTSAIGRAVHIQSSTSAKSINATILIRWNASS
jgi:hypothetical protein